MNSAPAQEFPTAEWYMWIDSDAMIVDPTFEIPFHTFGGKDLVAWGNEAELRAGNALAGRLHRPVFAHSERKNPKRLVICPCAWPCGVSKYTDRPA